MSRRSITAVRLHDEIVDRADEEKDVTLESTTLAEFLNVLIFQSFDEQREAAQRKRDADASS